MDKQRRYIDEINNLSLSKNRKVTPVTVYFMTNLCLITSVNRKGQEILENWIHLHKASFVRDVEDGKYESQKNQIEVTGKGKTMFLLVKVGDKK